MDYEEFLRAKTHSTGNFGFDPVWIPDSAFDFQAHMISKAVRKGRKAIGIELKDSYFKQAKINLELAGNRFKDGIVFKQEALFDPEIDLETA